MAGREDAEAKQDSDEPLGSKKADRVKLLLFLGGGGSV